MRGKLLTHVSIYSVGAFLTTIASLVSFPLFTRLFTVAEYGVMSIVSTTLLLLVGLGKVGMQHSAVRFYTEARERDGGSRLPTYYSTVLYGMLAFGVLTTLGWAVISQLLPESWWSDPRLRSLFLLTSLLVLIRVLDSSVINVLRAQERSAQFVLYTVLKKYFSLAIVVLVVVWFARDLWGFYIATIVTEGIAVALLLYLICRGQQSLPRNFSWPMLKTMAAFGIPMVVYEVTFVVLQLGDRFVIQGVLGNEAVGLYSAAYNLCEYTGMVFVTGFVQAVQPMYVRIWEQRGAQATQDFVGQALHFYLLVSAAIVAGLAATAHELIALLATEKYAGGAVVVPLVATGVMLSGMLPLTGAALYLNKTKSIMTLVAIVATLNIVLNVALVPPLGLMGSAWATLISYCVLLVLAGRISARVLPIAFPWAAAMKFALAAAAMYIVVMQIEMSNHVAQLSAKVIVGVILFSGIVLAVDAQSRVAARMGLDRVLRRLGRGSAEAPS